MKYRVIIILNLLLVFGLSEAGYAQKPIDRFQLVNRHNVIIDKADPLAPLSVGNGDFAYTADITGMQSFENYYYKGGIPLETMSTWAWHSFPNVKNLKIQEATKESNFHGRKIAYASIEKGEAGEYFRKNPHPIPLGQISLTNGEGVPFDLSTISNIHQKLDLWNGFIVSNYTIDGQAVHVETVCHPELSMVAFKIKSSLLRSGKLGQAFRFPYAYDLSVKNKPPFDWTQPDKHQTTVVKQGPGYVILKRTIDTSAYYVHISWQGEAKFEKKAAHNFYLRPIGTDSMTIVCEFSPMLKTGLLPAFETIKQMNAGSWKNYWTKGGAIDFTGSKDPRAYELERRVVLSQYLMKVNYAGSFPPQETGLTHISWYGKHNSEVYWWHTAQFYQWNRTELLEKSFAWYRKILPLAQVDAKSKGFEGAKWPKMTGIDGIDSPGSISPFIIWNEPNPIYLSELIYRAHPDKETLEKYKDVVFESAKYMASYAFFDPKTDRYILGPPIKSVNEHTKENDTQNPSFELAQWYYGLKVAQDWRVRLGLPKDAHWDDILKKLARLTVVDGKYIEIESEPNMYQRKGRFSSDMLMAMGYLPQTPMVDKQIMTNTFNAVLERNGLNSFISWSLAKVAMTAARVGNQRAAVDIVCNDLMGARFLKNGHIQRAKEPLACPAYLPANSSFLAAVALMAGGWDGAPQINAPGFPQDGSWTIRVENINKLP